MVNYKVINTDIHDNEGLDLIFRAGTIVSLISTKSSSCTISGTSCEVITLSGIKVIIDSGLITDINEFMSTLSINLCKC